MTRIDASGDHAPAYIQVADALAARIAASEYEGQLPSERHLAEEFGIAYQTQRHARKLLRTRGLIITQGREPSPPDTAVSR